MVLLSHWPKTMKRTVIVLCSLLCLAGLLLGITSLCAADPNAPKFVPMHSQPLGTYTWMLYPWAGDVPIQDGKVWIQTISNLTNRQCFLYDVTNRAIVGELFKAWPVFFNHDQTKLLCEGYSLEGAWKWKLISWLQNRPFGKRLARKMRRLEAFWILNLKDVSARRVGQLSQRLGTGSSFLTSPDFRYGLNSPSTSPEAEWFVCDVESNRFTKVTLSGQVSGWWDTRNVLVKERDGSFVLFDVETRQTRTLFSAAAVSKSLEQLGLPSDPAAIGTLHNWNGREYDFYFTLAKQRHSGESFLLKADRATRTLRLVKRNFQFHHLGRLDAEGTHYLYEGENGTPGAGGNGGLYLRDLSDDSVRTLVEPDNRGQYALARFCADGVIYLRNKQIFRVDLNGSNNAPLFQPGESR